MKQLTDEVFAQVRGALEQADIYLEEGSQSHSINRLAIAALDAAQSVPEVNAMLVEDVNSEIVKRYKVEKTKGGFWPYCVKAGDGTMDLFIGSKKQADHVQQALQSACLDGAFMAFTAAKQAQAEPSEMTKEREAYIAGLESRTHEMRKKIEQLDYELRVARSLQERATYTPPKISDPDAPHPCFN